MENFVIKNVSIRLRLCAANGSKMYFRTKKRSMVYADAHAGLEKHGHGGETAEALNLPMSTVAPSAQALKKACIITADETLPIGKDQFLFADCFRPYFTACAMRGNVL
ncbi:MAG: hypothetical protein IKO52_01300 [Clostridia bacterium]|nr:hypothetical protein [Clostridia bacterium]